MRARLLLAALSGFAIAKPLIGRDATCKMWIACSVTRAAPYTAKLNSAIGWMPAGACSWARFHAP